MIKKGFLKAIVVVLGLTSITNFTYATSVATGTQTQDYASYTVLRDIDRGTFNEYRYLMVREYFRLKEYYQLNGAVDSATANNILKYAKAGYNYLPDSLVNQNYFNDLSISLKKGLETPNSEVYYQDIVKKLNTYIEKVNITTIKGSITANPQTGNAPLTVTFKADVTDPSGTVIPTSSFVWWFDDAGKKKVIGRGTTFNYTFREMGNYSVFLDVKSSHKNSAGFTDVLPLSTRSIITVKEKVASMIISINGQSLKEADEIKFTPDESSYGLIFDATSSTPTGGAKFTRTEWDFGNGVQRRYDGSPRIERVVFSKEGYYTVKLKLTTNEGREIERVFSLSIHKPIATIASSQEDGYIGDKFTFSAKSSVSDKNLSFTWNIIDAVNDKVLVKKEGSVVNYSFSQKGRFNIQLKVKDASGNEDVDTKIIYINSRAPIADFSTSIPDSSKPNRIYFDGSKSTDPDFSDDGKLKYIWTIDGEVVTLDNTDSKGSVGYHTFDTKGDHAVTLEVIDPDQMNSVKTGKVNVASTLSVELFAFPRVIQRGGFVKFVSSAPGGKFYDWDFGDGNKKSGNEANTQYSYSKTGNYDVTLTVKDNDGNVNSTKKTIYVGDANSPVAGIGIDYGNGQAPVFDDAACENGAYKVDRTSNVVFRGGESINVDGQNTGLTYSWKLGVNKYLTTQDVTYKFDELGCFPVKLTVKSSKTGGTDSRQIMVKVENLKPVFSGIDIKVQNMETDPVVVNLTALGAKDPDGVIQSYLWYYYTDTDPEPQDFRITSLPSSTFVLPKITGNYNFVVVMKDNNDERYSSLENVSNKYSLTLNGDNVNTPLIDFSVNKNNVLIGEEVIFNAKVKNVLGQDITDKSEYAWDFDGDGFYDKETNAGTITNKYNASGTFYAKVRVKYKGMTNVRNIEMNVSNALEPSFEYFSVGDEIIFINTSKGKVENTVWDMGDGTKVTDKNTFSHIYEDGKTTHSVSLKISEGTKTKTTSKEVVTDMRNKLTLKNTTGIATLSYPEAVNDKITLSESSQKAVLYIGTNAQAKYYGVDYDIDADSDLNGTKDDDVDNKQEVSYSQAGMLEIPLTQSKDQTVRVMALDNEGKVVDSKDIVVSKDYIKEEAINMSTIVFEGVSDDEKVKIEKLKSFVQELPQENRLKAMKYVQQLQEEWFYDTEKTKVILDFEKYIDGLKLTNGSEIIALLESFLVKGQEDKSVSNMAYNVVKNLIPKEMVEYKDIMTKLESIKSNPDKLEENKKLGKEILDLIKSTSLISTEDKVTIKTQLQVLIYGAIDKIPQEIVQEVKDESGSGKLASLFSGVVDFILIILGLLVLAVAGFFIWFKVSNKNQNQGLQDFIIDKTTLDKGDEGASKIPETKVAEVKLTRDPLEKVATPPVTETPAPQSEPKKVPDWLAGATKSVSSESEDEKKNNIKHTQNTFSEPKAEEKVETKETPKVETQSEAKVPDWLAGAMEEPKAEEKVETKELPKVETQTEAKVPDWLAGAMEEPKAEEKVEAQAMPKVETQSEAKVPDWLAGAMEEPKAEEKVEAKEMPKVETQSEAKVPDWLAGAMEEPKAEEKVETKEMPKVETQSEAKVPDWLAGAMEEPKAEEKVEAKELPKVETQSEAKVPDWLAGAMEEPKAEEKVEAQEMPKAKKMKPSVSDDQGAAVPSWLVDNAPQEDAVIEKTSKKGVKKSEKVETQMPKAKVSKTTSDEKTASEKKSKTKVEPKVAEMEIPDWLKTQDDTTPPPTSDDDFWTLNVGDKK